MTGQDLAVAGALLPLAGFASYLHATLRGMTRPNRVSWALWAAAPGIAFAGQVAGGTSLRAALVTLTLGLGPAVILAASFRNPGACWRLGRLDWACAALACAALAAWALTRRGEVAIALAITADALAAAPTIRKAWQHPESESPWTYLASGAGAGITLLTITAWTFAAAAFSTWALTVCAAISVLILRPRTAQARAVTAFTAAAVPLAAIAWAGLHIAALLLSAEPVTTTPAAVTHRIHQRPVAQLLHRHHSQGHDRPLDPRRHQRG